MTFDGSALQTVTGTDVTLRDIEITATAQVEIQVVELFVQGDVNNDGTVTGNGVLTFIGADGAWSGSGSYGRTSVDTFGTVTTFGDVNVARDLLVAAGTLVVPSGTLSVDEDFFYVLSTIDLDGTLTVGGDFSADETFDASTGTGQVILDGTGSLTPLSPSGNIAFNQITVTGGQRTLVNGLNVIAPVSEVLGGADILIENDSSVRFSCTGLNIQGQASVRTNAVLEFDNGSTVTVGGTLSLIGSPTQPATLRGPGDGVESLQLNGFIEAQHFVFENLPPDGVIIPPSALFAPAPLDFRDGLFRNGSAQPGSTLLTIERATPLDLFNLSFENTPPTATFNVRILPTSAPVRFINASGGFAGNGFADDPADLVEFLGFPDVTILDTFQTAGLSNGIELLFRTAVEFDVSSFRLLRGTDPLGPFTEIPGSPLAPLGNTTQGALYTLQDLGLPGGVTQYYRLEQETAALDRILLGTGSTQPLASTIGDVSIVGPGGFPDVASALAVTPPGGTVLVEAGTYPAFNLSQAARIVAREGAAVTIDTTLGRASVVNLGPGSLVALYGMQFTPQGLDVSNCAGSVVLDQVEIVDSLGGDALTVSGSPQVKLQDCSLDGASNAVQLLTGSTAYLAKGGLSGQVTVDGTSTLTHVESGLVPGNLSAAPGSTVNELSGISPRVDIPRVLPLGALASLTVTGTADEIWIAYLSNGRGWLDLTTIGLPFDMVLLLDAGPAFRTYSVGLFPPSGFDTVAPGRPTDPALIGLTFPLQILSVNLGTSSFRLGNLRDVVILP